MIAGREGVPKPSMKVPPKRKGNMSGAKLSDRPVSLNESPSEKEGKSPAEHPTAELFQPSMKVPPKRKGNAVFNAGEDGWHGPQ